MPTLAGPIHALADPCRLGDTHRAMPEESATPDLVELTRRAFETGTRHDLDATWVSCSRRGLGSVRPWAGDLRGVAAIRGSLRTGSQHGRTSCWRPRRFSISAAASCSRPSGKKTARKVAPVT